MRAIFRAAIVGLFALSLPPLAAFAQELPALARLDDRKPRNVIFILVDDLRYNAFSFMGHPFLKTPHIDALARGGVHYKNAFVTTALCSPSRASVLTGLYAHNHKVVDNNDRPPPGTVFFPQYLQKAGCQTAFIGKWHMGGESDDPQPGFDHWVSFRGQGNYYSPGPRWTLNVDGKRVPQKGYITDELTDCAIEWLNDRKSDRPFFLYLSHKAVHAPFNPPPRHKGRYKNVEVREPETQADTPENDADKPMWVKNQRNSWHGVDFPYHSGLDVKQYYREYCETLLAVDESVGRVMDWLKQNNLNRETAVFFMGDNGFMFGEHGLIDKRNAYEESIRVPLIVHCPELFKPGTVDALVANIDIAPTILELSGLKAPDVIDGRSFVGLTSGQQPKDQRRKSLLYEYYWEWNFPHTPTMFALRREDFKLIQYHGIWDTDELYDLKNDPKEKKNLIGDPRQRELVAQMRAELHNVLKNSGGLNIPLGQKRGDGSNLRNAQGSKAAGFPEQLLREPANQRAR
jgi:N-acetylglucosamine-6-sulfatase